MTIAQRNTANGMIASKGQTVTIVGSISGTYDPVTGTTSNTPYSAAGTAVMLPANPFRKVPGTEIQAGDEQMLLSALADSGNALPQPPIGAVVTLADGSKRTLIAVDVLRPAGLNILYDCVVRGAA